MKHPAPRIWTDEECEPFVQPEFSSGTVLAPAPRGRPDGDTFDIATRIRFDAGPRIRIRLCGEQWRTTGGLIGFNAWERKGVEREDGDRAYARRLEICAPGDQVRIMSFKGGVRGSLYRWLAIILVRLVEVKGQLVRTDDGWEASGYRPHWYSVADVLLDEGHGKLWWRGWKRGKPQPAIPA